MEPMGRKRLALATALVAAMLAGHLVHGAQAPAPLTVKITSPLGRTGGSGAVRIVARIEYPAGAMLKPVRFLVDGELYKIDDDGPPYAVEWADENPFERREITVEAEIVTAN